MAEDVMVTALHGKADGFDLRLANDEAISAKRLVIATGLSHAEYIRQELAQLPEQV
jgi:thioredoxin reductase